MITVLSVSIIINCVVNYYIKNLKLNNKIFIILSYKPVFWKIALDPRIICEYSFKLLETKNSWLGVFIMLPSNEVEVKPKSPFFLLFKYLIWLHNVLSCKLFIFENSSSASKFK